MPFSSFYYFFYIFLINSTKTNSNLFVKHYQFSYFNPFSIKIKNFYYPIRFYSDSAKNYEKNSESNSKDLFKKSTPESDTNCALALALALALAVSDSTESSDNIKPVKFYENAFQMKKLNLKENKGLAGVYKWINKINKINNNIYVGSSIELSNRFTRYFNRSYLKSNNYTIFWALLKYGYEKFRLEILEYCNASIVLKREQYFLDLLNPIYNIAKTAGSSLGIKRSVETKIKIRKSLKGVYTGNKSKLFGKTIDNATRNKMSISKAGANNPL